MCRLYGLRATHATTPSCELIEAQNSLLRQAVEDERGQSNPHGWGFAERLEDGSLDYERQAEPASESESFRREVMDTPAIATIAHVRRATVGEPRLENTHPFVADNAALAHNGHIGEFEEVRTRMRLAMNTQWRDGIQGSTDSEHIFALLMSRLEARTQAAMLDTLSSTISDIQGWASDQGADAALNLLWLVDDQLIGSKVGRSLYYTERDHGYECPICGRTHGLDTPDYQAVVVASEQITQEGWREVPEDNLWWVEDWKFTTSEI